MIHKKQGLFLWLFVALGSCSWGADPVSLTFAVPTLPAQIHATLDQEYPGWKYAPVTVSVQQEFKKHKVSSKPSLAVGDFDHDGKLDYTIQIALTSVGQEEQIVIVFLARAGGYEENIIQSMGLDQTVYVWVSRNKVLNRDTLLVLGGPAGDSAYAYEDGKFHEISIEDDASHP